MIVFNLHFSSFLKDVWAFNDYKQNIIWAAGSVIAQAGMSILDRGRRTKALFHKKRVCMCTKEKKAPK